MQLSKLKQAKVTGQIHTNEGGWVNANKSEWTRAGKWVWINDSRRTGAGKHEWGQVSGNEGGRATAAAAIAGPLSFPPPPPFIYLFSFLISEMAGVS